MKHEQEGMTLELIFPVLLVWLQKNSGIEDPGRIQQFCCSTRTAL